MLLSRSTVLGLILALISSFASAKTTIENTATHVYFKTPYQEFQNDEKIEIIKNASNYVTQWLKPRVPGTEFGEKTIEILSQVNQEIGPLIDAIDDYVTGSDGDKRGVWAGDLLPSAFSFYFGGDFSLSFGLGGAFDPSIGLIILPVKVVRVNKITKQIDQYYEFDAAWVLIPQFKVGKGVGAKAGYGGGVGLIWGPMDKASDYRGPFLSVEVMSMAGIAGFNVKAGMLHQLKRSGVFQNLFVSAGFLHGVGAEASVKFGGAAVIDGKVIIEALMSSVGVPFEEADQSNQIPVPPEFQEDESQIDLPID